MTANRARLIVLSGVLLSLLLLAALMLGGVSSLCASEPGSLDGVQSAAKLRLVRSDARGIILELDTPAYSIVPGEQGATFYQIVSAPGLSASGQAGAPALPTKGVLLGIPPGVDVEIEVLEAQTEILPGRFQIVPVSGPVLGEDEMGWIHLLGQTLAEDPGVYGANRLYPALPAEVTAIGYVRDQRVARLTLYPFQQNPASGQLIYHRRLKVALNFEGLVPLSPGGVALENDPGFEAVLAQALLNYAPAQPWRTPPPIPATPRAFEMDNEGLACKIAVDREGIYQVTYADLRAAGCDLDLPDPGALHLYNQGQEIAIQVLGEGDGRFDPGDAILFYGQGLSTKYSSTNVYWLTAGAYPGLRMEEVEGHPSESMPAADAFSTTVHVEQDRVYWASPSPSSGLDYWFWERLWGTPGVPVTFAHAITLPELAPGPYTATLRVAVKSRYDEPAHAPDHHLQLYLNHDLVQDITWDGEAVQRLVVDLPQTALRTGANLFEMVLPGDLGVPYDNVYLDWLELDYYRTFDVQGDRLAFTWHKPGLQRFKLRGFSQRALAVYDVSQPAMPRQIVSYTVSGVDDRYTLRFQTTITSPRRYLALASEQMDSPVAIVPEGPSALRSPANSADYLLITHADFIGAAQALAEHRTSQGFEAVVVDVQDIYDEFSFGIFDPEAIRSFLSYAYAHWQKPAPSYVLLMGDGHLDFHDNLGLGERNYIPPYLAQVDPWLGETASDNRYVAVSGDDSLPDLFIGRLPVSSPTEASAVVTKIIQYEQSPPAGAWRARALWVADNADGVDDFAMIAEAMAQYLPPTLSVDRVYYGITLTVPSQATAAIVGAINEGRLMVTYVGHGAVQFWAAERLLALGDLGNLTNAGYPPLMLPWTCYEGLFDYPGFPSLGESIVRAQGRGAIASWSPSGLGMPAAHQLLASGFYQAVFGEGLYALGPATNRAKLALWAEAPEFGELVDTYLLLGDPATELALARPELGLAKTASPPTVRPGDLLTYTIVYSNSGDALATGVVITEAYAANTSLVRAVPPPDRGDNVWDIGRLDIHERGALTVTMRTGKLSSDRVLTNRVTIACDQAPPLETTASQQLIPYRIYLPQVLRRARAE